MQFLKTLLIILLIFFGIRIMWRLFSPYLARYVAKKAGEKFENMVGQFGKRANTRPLEGTTTIDKEPQTSQAGKKPVGEYIDFEEID